MFKKFLKKALSGKPITYKKKATPIKKAVKRVVARKPRFKQYGDKGYRPSNGLGVGY